MQEREKYLGCSFYNNGLHFSDGFVGYGTDRSSTGSSFSNSPLQELAQRRGAQFPANTHGRCALNRVHGVCTNKNSKCQEMRSGR